MVIIPHLQAQNTVLTGEIFSHNTAGSANTHLIASGPRFQVTHVSEDAADQTTNTGFKLQYQQLPCGGNANLPYTV